MTRSHIRLAAAFASAALAGFAFAATVALAENIQTIDCGVDHNRAERAICSSQRLQILDAKITEAYADMMHSRRLTPIAKAHLRESQHAFLVRRDACGASYGCLEDVMSTRVSRIRLYE